jgi:phage terminase large subunit
MNVEIIPEFDEFLEPHRYKVAYGGRGSGKSWSIATILALRAYQKPTRILCCREIQKSITDSVLTLLADQIERLGLSSFFEVQKTQITGQNGSRFIFEGLRSNITKIKSMEGIDIVWAEEAESITVSSWQTLIPTIRKPGSEIWISFNPYDELDETYQRFVVSPPPDTYKVLVNFQHNPWFPEELRKEMEYMKSQDVELYKHIWEGQCLSNKEGAYYSKQLKKLDEQGHITSVNIESSIPVTTYWDLGVSDSTAIWFVQVFGNEIRVVDYYENHSEGLNHYINYLLDWRDKNHCTFGHHYAPHDIRVRELTTGKSRLEIARKMGINFQVVPSMPIQDGIQAARNILPRCWFDADRCKLGLRALRNYRREWDEVRNVFKKQPLHDWTSHGSDAFRYFAISHRDVKKHSGQPIQAQSWDVF